MVRVVVKIVARTATDPYARHQGLAIDESLPRGFWNEKPDTEIGVSGGKSFTWQKEIDFAPGLHTLEYGNGAFCYTPEYGDTLKWEAWIYINGNEVAYGPCLGRDKHLIAQIKIEAEAPAVSPEPAPAPVLPVSPAPEEPIAAPVPEVPSPEPTPVPGPEPEVPSPEVPIEEGGFFRRLLPGLPLSPTEPDPNTRPWQNLLPIPKQPIFPKAKILVRVKGIKKRMSTRPRKKLFAR